MRETWPRRPYLMNHDWRNRSSRTDVFCKKGVLRNFAKFIEKHLCQSLFFNKAAGLRPAILLKKRLWHSCFPVNFGKFLRTPFSQNTPGRLLLKLLEILHEEARGLSRLDKNKALSEKQSLQIFV